VWFIETPLKKIATLKVIENRVHWRMFGCIMEKVQVNWREVHSEKLVGLYFSSDFTKVITARKFRWVRC
jgi:hypothetical protein